MFQPNLTKSKYVKNSQKAAAELSAFMEPYKCDKERDKGKPKTVVSFGKPWLSFIFPQDKEEEFIQLYGEFVKYGNELHLTQMPFDVTPFPVDIDFKQNCSERQYTSEHIDKIAQIYMQNIKKFLDIPIKNIRGFVFEKDAPTFNKDKNHHRDGFHIIFDAVAIDKKTKLYLTDLAMKQAEEEDVFSDMDLLTDYQQMFDTSVTTTTGWCLPGSRKHDGKMYSLTRIVALKGEIGIEKFPVEEQAKLLSMHRYSKRDKLKINPKLDAEDVASEIDKVWDGYSKGKNKTAKVHEDFRESFKKASHGSDYEFGDDFAADDNLDDIDEDNPDDGVDTEDELEENEKKNPIVVLQAEFNADIPEWLPEDIKTAKELMKMISTKRAVHYDTWRNVGWALCNISPIHLRQDWMKFSEGANKHSAGKYDPSGCGKLWEDAKKRVGPGFNLPSLRAWAMEDNKEMYNRYASSRIDKMADEAVSGHEFDIALMMKELYGDEYVCASIANDTWFQFRNHRWEKIEKAYTMNLKISTDLPKRFVNLASTYLIKSNIAGNYKNMEYDTYRQRASKAQQMADKLRKSAFKNNVISECKNIFYKENFIEDLDANKYLIGFNNGVYDLNTGEFRAGIPEDMISMSTGNNYMEFDLESEEMQIITKFFSEVQPDEDMRDYLLTFLASCLDGATKMQKVIIWTGGGSNGKSTAIEFFTKAFGDYTGTIPITLLTRKRSAAGSATPELAHLAGKRFAVFQEPEHDDHLNLGIMKELSGTDKISARALYGNPFEYTPQFKMILTCNNLPFIPATDKGTWRRLRVTPWEVEFIDPDQTIEAEYQFYKDFELEEKLGRCKEALMWYLLKYYYPKYRKYGLKEPGKVTEQTKRWKKKSDIYAGFIEESLDITRKKKDYEDISLVYASFKDWYSESYNEKAPNKQAFVEYFQKHDYTLKNGKIYGIKLKGNKVMMALDIDELGQEEEEQE